MLRSLLQDAGETKINRSLSWFSRYSQSKRGKQVMRQQMHQVLWIQDTPGCKAKDGLLGEVARGLPRRG